MNPMKMQKEHSCGYDYKVGYRTEERMWRAKLARSQSVSSKKDPTGCDLKY